MDEIFGREPNYTLSCGLGCKIAVPKNVELFDRRTVSVLGTILAFVGLLSLLWAARRPVIVFIFAILFAHVLKPLVASIEKWLGTSRSRAVAITYVAIIAALVIFGMTVGPHIVQQGRVLEQTLPDLLGNVKSGDIAWQLGAKQGWSFETQARIQQWLVLHQDDIARYSYDVMAHLKDAVSNITWILLMPIVAIFFLTDRSTMSGSALKLIRSAQHRRLFERVLDDVDTMLAKYVRGQLLLSFFAFIAYGAFLLIARLQYAFVIAAVAGVLEFIPIAGPLITLGVLVVIAFLTGYSPWPALAAFWLIWRLIQDYVNAPRVMGKGLDLPPLLVIFAVLAGGEVAGIPGILLSVPAVAALRILWLNWIRRPPVRNAA
jgi:predicted PurR-regulated permease PerM